MVRVSHFLKYLESIKAQGQNTTLALYNHLQNFSSSEDALTSEHFNFFFADALSFSNWQESYKELDNHIKQAVDRFVQTYQVPFDLNSIVWPSMMQIVSVARDHDFLQLVHRYLERVCGDDQEFRVLLSDNKNALALIRDKETGHLKLQSFNRDFTLRGGYLEPLQTHGGIYYNASLQLSTGVQQRITTSGHTVIDFQVNDSGRTSGKILRGYTFQVFQNLKDLPFDHSPAIYYPIKRLESFFINKQTDSFYTTLVAELERATRLMRMGDKKTFQSAPSLLSRAETIFEQVYCEDRVLGLLIREHRRTMEELGFTPSRSVKHDELKNDRQNESWRKSDLTNL